MVFLLISLRQASNITDTPSRSFLQNLVRGTDHFHKKLKLLENFETIFRVKKYLYNANHVHSLAIIWIFAELMQSTGRCTVNKGINAKI